MMSIHIGDWVEQGFWGKAFEFDCKEWLGICHVEKEKLQAEGIVCVKACNCEHFFPEMKKASCSSNIYIFVIFLYVFFPWI